MIPFWAKLCLYASRVAYELSGVPVGSLLDLETIECGYGLLPKKIAQGRYLNVPIPQKMLPILGGYQVVAAHSGLW
jgi:hypothetical protein